MAPELIIDPNSISDKSDIYSLGVILLEMLTSFEYNNFEK